ncbi:MAG: leucine-rich repeat protein [Clostridia bacterium]|nr:leucine-rich repeat protein [Clostridia bacterium]
MKKKLLLTLALVAVFVLMLTFVVSAESVHAGKVDLNATVTLSGSYVDADGNAITTVNLFDKEGNALIWYKNGSTLESIRADDERVIYKCTYSFGVGNSTVGSVTAYEVSDMWIQLDESTKIDKGNIVVLNLMDDDVLINNNRDIGKPVNCLKTIAWANKVLEYAFCRLDTVALQQQAFCGCTMLKYINLEDLTELRQIGGSQTFGQSSNLFKGETLDLTGTKLSHISGEGAFNGVPAAAIKLPKTVVALGNWCIQGTAITSIAFPTGVATIAGSQFNDCKSLTTIYINNTTTNISARAFNNTALEKVFFVGTLGELNALLDNTDFTNNTPLSDVVGENRANLISYEAYKALEDKSGKYVVYNYNYCEAYNEGKHNITGANECVGSCSVCLENIVSHKENNSSITVTIVYANGYSAVGVKTTDCGNEGCDYCVTEEAPALIIPLGYTAPEIANGNIAIGYRINNEAINDYEKITGKTVRHGVFVATKAGLGGNDIFDEGSNAVVAEISNDKLIKMEIKLTGFDKDDYKTAPFAMGAYIITEKDEVKEVKYFEQGTPAEGDKYYFTTYQTIVGE